MASVSRRIANNRLSNELLDDAHSMLKYGVRSLKIVERKVELADKRRTRNKTRRTGKRAAHERRRR